MSDSDSDTDSLVLKLRNNNLWDCYPSDGERDGDLDGELDGELDWDDGDCSDELDGDTLTEESEDEGIPDSNWAVSRDHPFKKDFVPLPGGDQIYISSDESDEEGGEQEDNCDEEEEEGKDEECLCGKCGERGVDGGRVCCAGFNLPDDEACITEAAVLKHAFEYPSFMRTLSHTMDRQKRKPDPEDTEEYNRLMRHTAYVFAKDELQLRGHRRTKLPDCLVIWVRRLFPSPAGHYVGFVS
eukprot:sb/3469054/